MSIAAFAPHRCLTRPVSCNIFTPGIARVFTQMTTRRRSGSTSSRKSSGKVLVVTYELHIELTQRPIVSPCSWAAGLFLVIVFWCPAGRFVLLRVVVLLFGVAPVVCWCRSCSVVATAVPDHAHALSTPSHPPALNTAAKLQTQSSAFCNTSSTKGGGHSCSRPKVEVRFIQH